MGRKVREGKGNVGVYRAVGVRKRHVHCSGTQAAITYISIIPRGATQVATGVCIRIPIVSKPGDIDIKYPSSYVAA